MTSDIETKAQRVVELEQQAAEMHLKAQQYNKEGNYDEAQKAYATMHKLEDEASKLAKEVGCVQCVLGETSGTGCNFDVEELEMYSQLYRVGPWPAGEYTTVGSHVNIPCTT